MGHGLSLPFDFRSRIIDDRPNLVETVSFFSFPLTSFRSHASPHLSRSCDDEKTYSIDASPWRISIHEPSAAQQSVCPFHVSRGASPGPVKTSPTIEIFFTGDKRPRELAGGKNAEGEGGEEGKRERKNGKEDSCCSVTGNLPVTSAVGCR